MEKNENKEGNVFVGMFYTNAIYALAILVVTVSATSIFNFLGVEFEYYGIYLFFFIGLAILSQILPKNKSSLLRTTATDAKM
jgi:hypothetical protein